MRTSHSDARCKIEGVGSNRLDETRLRANGRSLQIMKVLRGAIGALLLVAMALATNPAITAGAQATGIGTANERYPEAPSNGQFSALKESRAASTACGTTGRFSGGGVVFRYSSCWSSSMYSEESSFSWLIVDLSDQPTHNPCRTTKTATRTTVSCGWPIRRIEKSHVLIQWFGMGTPGWHLENEPGTSLTVGGRPAREEIRHQSCGSIGGNEVVTIFISRRANDNYYLISACLRAPEMALQLQRINQMLRSVRLTSS
jgi:hypothetical protein